MAFHSQKCSHGIPNPSLGSLNFDWNSPGSSKIEKDGDKIIAWIPGLLFKSCFTYFSHFHKL